MILYHGSERIMSQSELARESGINLRTLQQYEIGANKSQCIYITKTIPKTEAKYNSYQVRIDILAS